MDAKTADKHTVQAHITVHDAKEAIAFYAKAFGAVESFRLTDPSGRLGHAEIRIGNSVLMMNDEHPAFGAMSPASIGGSPVMFHIQVADADKAVDRAVKAGATLVRPVQDPFYGDRSGMVACPFGYRWFLATTKDRQPRRDAEALEQDARERHAGVGTRRRWPRSTRHRPSRHVRRRRRGSPAIRRSAGRGSPARWRHNAPRPS